MELAQMKAAVTMEGLLSGTAALELIAEVERLTSRLVEYKREAQKSCRRENDLKAARDRAEQQVKDLTALCDGYRGEVAALKAVEARVEHIKRSYAGGENWLRCLERAEQAESAITRARAEGMEDFACYLIDHCEREYITEEFLQNRLADCLKAAEACRLAGQAERGEKDA